MSLSLSCDLRQRYCLVAGGTPHAMERVRQLLEAGADVRVCAAARVRELTSPEQNPQIRGSGEGYHSDLLNGCWLAVAATDSPELNQQICREASARQIFCEVTHSQDSSCRLSAAEPPPPDASALPVFPPAAPLSAGEVTLAGAGPGDAGLLTLHALSCLQQAEVVFYDRLVSDEILALINPQAERIYAGKQSGRESVPQQQISQWLISAARAGKRVLRLKGGDPLIFGRGGEELQALVKAGIRFSVIPGITAASGCAAYAGIPLTHRDYAGSLRLITGHLKQAAKPAPITGWSPAQTLVFYMGLQQAEEIRLQLSEAGAASDTPVAVVINGTRRQQQVITGQLRALPSLCPDTVSPALIIVGEVVRLQQTLNWFIPDRISNHRTS